MKKVGEAAAKNAQTAKIEKVSYELQVQAEPNPTNPSLVIIIN